MKHKIQATLADRPRCNTKKSIKKRSWAWEQEETYDG